MLLDAILKSKRLEVEERAARRPLGAVKKAALAAPMPRDFLAAVRRPGLSVIAEVKRASPSKGEIRPDLDAPALARGYQKGGAAAVSVLTDTPYFGAKPGDLEAVRGAVSLPVLRKDFILSEYQLYESRAMGADAVLLIVAALPQADFFLLYGIAEILGLCPLIEVHTAQEIEVARECGAEVIGINNRDLTTFQVDLDTTRKLIRLIPSHAAVVSESGIIGVREVGVVRGWGADAVLVGESLVRSDDPVQALRELTVHSRQSVLGSVP